VPAPGRLQQVAHELGIGEREIDVHCREALPPERGEHVAGSLATAARISSSPSITCSSLDDQSVAKILPRTRNEGRPW
jgi:hypothetical protein